MKPIIPLIVASAWIALPGLSQETAAYETGVVLSAADLLAPELLAGPSHRVRDQVVTDGYLAHFQIDSDFGVFEAVGVPQVAVRVVEINGMRRLVETSKSDLFAEGLKRSIEQPIDAVKNIVTSPVETLKQAPRTVGHFFAKVGGAIERGANRAADAGNDGKAPSATGIGEAAKRAAGFDKARLETARQIGVDPYSDNLRLQEEMDKVTWAFFAGGLPLRIGAAAASAGVTLTATNMIGVPEDAYALTQGELALLDRRSLTAMGIDDAAISRLEIHPVFTTTRRHRLVKSLEALEGVAGRDAIVGLANSCETAAQADFLIASVALLVDRQRDHAAGFRSIHLFGRLPAAATADGVLEIPAPVDHVTWTERVADFAAREDLGDAPKSLIHRGTFSDAASAGFKASGWRMVAMPEPPTP